MTGVLIKRENLDTETHTEGRQCEQTWWGRGCVVCGHLQIKEKDPEQILRHSPQKEPPPADTLIFDFWLPEL